METLHLGEVVAVVLAQPAEPLGPGELGAPLGEREQEFTWYKRNCITCYLELETLVVSLSAKCKQQKM